MIEVRDLTKLYGSRAALSGVTFSVETGGVVGFLGANGAGKTTLMRILTGFLAPTSGTAKVGGLDVQADSVAVRRRIGYLPESNPLYPEMRVVEFLRYRARVKGLARRDAVRAAARAMERCGLAGSERRVIGQLSKGYRQRVGLADCLLAEAPLLILDEPTVGLDPNQLRDARDLIAEIGRERTVFLSSHILHEIELLCREVVILHAGRLVAVDAPQALCARSTRPRALLVELAPGAHGASAFARLDGVLAAEEAGPAEEGGRGYRLSVDPGRDVRREVLSVCAEKGWILQVMRLEPVRFEEIFAEFTTGGRG